MGDQLEEDWIKEDVSANEEADWVAEDEDDEDNSDGSSSDQSSDNEDDDHQVSKENKKLKRKQKFQELKARKKQKIQEEQEAVKSAEQSELTQLQVDEMLDILQQHAPDSFKLSSLYDNEFTSENFFHPVLVNATESVTKAPCPFVRALSVGLQNYRKLLSETPSNKQDNGAPIILIVCSSANRASEIIKSISSKLIKCKIAKLFAKHFKITEQIEMLSKDYYPIAIGTPNRLNKLIELGALQLNRLKVVLLDYTPDIKHFTLFTLPEVKDDTYQLLYGSIYQERQHLKISFIKDQLVPADEKEKADSGKKRQQLQYQQSIHKKKNQFKQKNNSKRQGINNSSHNDKKQINSL